MMFFAVLLVWFLTLPASSQTEYKIERSQTIEFKSSINEVNYKLYIQLPESYKSNLKSYPVIMLMDAEYSFPTATSIANHLSQRGQLPETIIVSVGYKDGKDPIGYRVNRSRDYTPTHVPNGGYGQRFQAQSGGAHDFIRVIREEIFPNLDNKFRTSDKNHTFVGHSFGGLLGAYIIQNTPDLFENYLLVSPSLWYDDGLVLKEDFSNIKNKTNIYLSVGEFEEQSPPRHQMISDLNKFEGRLKSIKANNIQITMREFEGETHASVFPTALSTGLRWIFNN